MHAVLYSIGALHWLVLLRFGDIPFRLLDWKGVFFWFSVLKEAAVSGVAPTHMAHTFLGTDRFLAIPLTMLAPHAVLLRWLSMADFVLVHILVFYSIGYLGALLFKRKYALSWPGFGLFYLLFNFNGYVTSHLAVGHIMWVGYFLLPWFFLLVLQWVEKGPSVRISLGAALVLFGLSLPGSFHMCTWCMIFLVLLGLRRPGWMKHVALVALAGAGLTAYRLIPGVAAFGSMRYGSPVGYPGLGDMMAGLVSLRPPNHPTVNALGWWEYDMYVGMIGLAILFALGAAPLIARGLRVVPRPVFQWLDLPLAGMVFLSYGDAYYWALSGIPILSVERAVTRILSLPLVLLAMLAAIRFEALRRTMRPERVFLFLSGCGLFFLAADLARHSWAWRLSALQMSLPHKTGVALGCAVVIRPDPVYVACLIAGAAVTLAALASSLLIIRRSSARP